MLSDPVPSEHLIAELRAGKNVHRHFEALFRAYYASVRGYFEKQSVPAGEREELIQEVFLAVFNGLSELQNLQKFRAWLFGISRNIFLHWLESTKQHRERHVFDAGECLDVVADSGPDALDHALRAERRVRLHSALEALPDQMRACVKLSIVEELSYPEIAERLQISVGSVKVQLFRARHLLAQKLNEQSGVEHG